MEIREQEGKIYISGYVSIPEKKSRVMTNEKGKFIEVVEPRVFQNALNKALNVELLLNHNSNKHLGSIKEGNVTLIEDNVGLKIDAVIDNEEVREAYFNGGFSGFSYGFISKKEKYEPYKGLQLRTISDLDLYEVSLLTCDRTPAFYGTLVNAEVRELDGESKEIEFREISYDDIEMKILSIIQEPLTDEEKYDVQVKKVYEDYFIYKNYKENKYYKQGYNVQDETVSLIGIREEVFKLYLTQEEVNQLTKKDVEDVQEQDNTEISLLEQEIEIMKLKGDVEQ